MSDIDPEKLEADIAEAERTGFVVCPSLITHAARAHLATLPRWKEIEVSVWKVVDSHGNYGTDCTQEEAERISQMTACHAVRLTGTAKVKVTP